MPDGLDAAGRPVGRPHPSPWVQVAATSEDQTDNLFAQLYEMLRDSPAIDELRLDLGVTRIGRRGLPGRIEPVTSSAGAREGQPVSEVVLEETHLWNRQNGGRALAAVLRRNAAKMNARTLELTNAFAPGAGSVAELSEDAITSGRVPGALLVCREGPHVDDLHDGAAVRAALAETYGLASTDHGGWVDLDRLVAEAPDTEPGEYRRFYLNQVTSEEQDLVEWAVWQALEVPDQLQPNDIITIGFDGSDSDDATALYACRWPDLALFRLGLWEKPETGTGWLVPRQEVSDAVELAFEQYRVVRFYADPPRWRTDIERWQASYGDAVHEFSTASNTKADALCDRFCTLVRTGELRHAADEALDRHVAAARRVPTPSGFRIGKKDTRKIDAVIAVSLALHAMGDALEAGLIPDDGDPSDQIF
jgi:phage terminase large subunit-like protein